MLFCGIIIFTNFLVMKKRLLPIVFAAAAFLLAACAPTPAEIARKITENKELSSEDYKVAVEYTLGAMEDIADTISKYEDDRHGLVTAFKAMMPEYKEGDIILAKLQQSDPSALDEETRKIYEKAMRLQEENAIRFAKVMGYTGTVLDPAYKAAHEESSDSLDLNSDSITVSDL